MSGATQVIERARRAGRTVLTETESKRLLAAIGIPTTEMRAAATREEAVAAARAIGYPCVLKVSSPDITHKSDAGGVKVGLADDEQVAEAWDAIMVSCRRACPEAAIEGVCVQTMAPQGLEVIFGMATDPQFGPVLMFGLGGVWVEVLQDVSFKIVPLTRDDARCAIREVVASRLFEGYRGSDPVDTAALEDILLRLSEFVAATPQVLEMDINPVFAYPDGALAVDARVILGE